MNFDEQDWIYLGVGRKEIINLKPSHFRPLTDKILNLFTVEDLVENVNIQMCSCVCLHFVSNKPHLFDTSFHVHKDSHE